MIDTAQPVVSDAQPTAAQHHWMELGFGMFLHFGINTFYDVEWSDGTLDASAFNPTEFDPEQWCRVAREAGTKFVVLVCKHHDGFCNWPTAHTEYSVKNTPFGRDVVGEVVAAARAEGLSGPHHAAAHVGTLQQSVAPDVRPLRNAHADRAAQFDR